MRAFTLFLILAAGVSAQDGIPEPIRLEPAVAAVNLEKRTDPVYPPLAHAARVQGSVVLDSTIDKEGRVADLKVAKGHALLNDAALQAVRQWRYKPYEVKGEPRPVTTTVTVHFFLDSMPRIPAGSAAITGRIVHADGTPAAGVRVDVVLAPVGSSPPKFTESSGAYELRIAAAPLVRLGFPTDSSGDYRIDGIGPGTYKVIATVGDTGIYYPGASHDKAVSLTIESNETILVGIDFTVP